MNSTRILRTWLRSCRQRHRAELRLCIRLVASGVLTLLVSQQLHLRYALWAVLTAVLLTQLNVGRSLKATTDYLAGTLGGAIFAGTVGAVIADHNEVAQAFVLAIALAPAALVAAENARFGAAPFTAVLVTLAPVMTHLGPIASAFERIVEVAVGCGVGLLVSFIVFPERAYDSAISAAARTLDLMAGALPKLSGSLTQAFDEAAVSRILEEIDEAYAGLHAVAMEGAHERLTCLTPTPDLAPLLRTLRRLRDDVTLIAGTTVLPLPAPLQAWLEPALSHINGSAAGYLSGSAAALAARKPPPLSGPVGAALEGYAAKIEALRQQSLKEEMSLNSLERVFTLGLAFEQLHRNFTDLERCIVEHRERF
ncbi:FUSC family protein [Bradyrhizobium tropiciagri]|uniref:FUSC family protein n=1 Tax=Bradyrhizobium tropiciagri TaxID=312253 RepID=UPI000AA3BD24|nr:FUSC family protein [Bradyrhizobium tropiciagri]